MKPQNMSLHQRWLYALKIKSWPKLLVPFFLGQALGAYEQTSFSWPAFGLGLAFTFCLACFIVFLNDWADQDIDTLKRKMFGDACSPKTIPDKVLPAKYLLITGVLSGLLAFAISLIGELVINRPGLILYAAICLLIFLSYSLPPFKLNYRGGGELLETFGVSLALPAFNAYAQSGKNLPDHGWVVLLVYLLLSLTSAIASGLSDEESDRLGGKHTFVTYFGNSSSRRVIEFLFLVSFCILPMELARSVPLLPWEIILTADVILLWSFVQLRQQSPKSVKNAFPKQAKYKSHLHLGIWAAMIQISAYLIIMKLIT